MFVDFVAQNRIYGFEVQGDIAREKPVGFELKKNVSIHYKDNWKDPDAREKLARKETTSIEGLSLKPREQPHSPFAETPRTNERAHWVKPEVVVEVKFAELTSDNKLRQPIFLGIRDDKNASDVHLERESIQRMAKGRAEVPNARVASPTRGEAKKPRARRQRVGRP